MPKGLRFVPGVLLALGVLLLSGATQQQVLPLAGRLADLPDSLLGYSGADITVSPEEQRVAGFTDYLMRLYGPDTAAVFSLYVGYYDSQLQGRTIHSPKNCLPGAGWEPVSVGTAEIPLPEGAVTVNRYLLEREHSRALVYYWYQGRGRVAWNEYAVKWDLLRDKAVLGRSEEALVRIVVPSRPGLNTDSVATVAAGQIIPALRLVLPPAGLAESSSP